MEQKGIKNKTKRKVHPCKMRTLAFRDENNTWFSLLGNMNVFVTSLTNFPTRCTIEQSTSNICSCIYAYMYIHWPDRGEENLRRLLSRRQGPRCTHDRESFVRQGCFYIQLGRNAYPAIRRPIYIFYCQFVELRHTLPPS